ncbi:MAG TPA: SCO family protein [Burkholderiaceae bacterium]|nr:SCO family protein [Burkholderiaceae bacterium]
MNTICRSALLAVALSAALVGCEKPGASSPPAVAFRGADITGAEYARTLALPDVNGQPRTLGDFKGKVTVVFFGYTQCPDVCPTTMTELAQVKKSLGVDGDKLQAVFVTIDPERDTPEVLKSYMASFDPSFVALRGTLEQTQAAAKEFKVYFAKVPGKTEGSYTMDHSAGAFVLDTRGNVRLFERYGADAEGLSADVKALIAQG